VAQAKAPAPAPVAAASKAAERTEDVARRGQMLAAEAGLKAYLDRNPGKDEAWTNYGILLERVGKTEEAEQAYRKALELKPDQQGAWDNLTRLYCRTGRAAQAEAHSRTQLQARPGALAPRTALVLALLAQKKLTEAASEARRVLKADERNVKAMQLLAQVYYRERKHELAKMVLDNARAIAPEDAATHNALGLVQLALNARPAALESFQKAVTLQPDFAEARTNFGALLNEAQDFTAAVHQLEAAVRAAPDFLAARLNLGNAYRGQGDFARALAEYQHVAWRTPDLPDVYFNLAILHLDAEPPGLDTLERLQASIRYLEQYRAKGGKDERVEQYLEDARKGIDKEERRREREKREQLKKARKATEETTQAGKSGAPAPPTLDSGTVKPESQASPK
jgi:tetratricopeptide (TPR) repeat protein